MSERVRRGRFIARSCLSKSGLCRYVFGEVGIFSGRVRRCRLIVGKVGLVSVRVRRGRVCVGTCR